MTQLRSLQNDTYTCKCEFLAVLSYFRSFLSHDNDLVCTETRRFIRSHWAQYRSAMREYHAELRRVAEATR